MNGKEPDYEGQEVDKGKKRPGFYRSFPFVTVVLFVVRNSFPVKNGKTILPKGYVSLVTAV